MSARREICAAAGAVVLWLAGAANAHDVGLSQSTFTLDRDTVRAHVVLAAPDVADLLDADGDGLVTFDEVGAGRPRLGTLAVRDTEVAVGGARCGGALDGVAIEGADGIALDATFACPPAQGELTVVLHWLGARPPTHRHVMRLVAADRTMSAVLTRERQGTALALATPASPAGASVARQAGSWAWWLAALGLAAIVLFVLRARARASARGDQDDSEAGRDRP